MVNVLDPHNVGYIDFKGFQENFGPNMSQKIHVVERELHKPNLHPNKEKLQEYGARAATIKDTVNQVRKDFQPQIDMSK